MAPERTRNRTEPHFDVLNCAHTAFIYIVYFKLSAHAYSVWQFYCYWRLFKKCQETPGLPGMPAFVGAINARRRLSAGEISFKFLPAASEFCRPPAKTAICNLWRATSPQWASGRSLRSENWVSAGVILLWLDYWKSLPSQRARRRGRGPCNFVASIKLLRIWLNISSGYWVCASEFIFSFFLLCTSPLLFFHFIFCYFLFCRRKLLLYLAEGSFSLSLCSAGCWLLAAGCACICLFLSCFNKFKCISLLDSMSDCGQLRDGRCGRSTRFIVFRGAAA